MTTALQVVTTTATQADAETIAAALVERRLAACVQISGPILSRYRWQGALETAEEWVCTIKTTQAGYEAVERAIRELHPYQVPEILATPVVAGNPAYLEWLGREVAE
jgi:periplasmic divalent cation tolerance protein